MSNCRYWDSIKTVVKTIKVSKQAKTVNALLKKARQEGVILRAPDGNEFILRSVRSNVA